MDAKTKLEWVPRAKLRPFPHNPRTIGDVEFAHLKRGIQEFGLVDPLIVNRDGTVIGGHQRLKAAEDLKIDPVPVVYIDVTDPQAAALNVLLNNPNAQGTWDFPVLVDLLSELDATGFDCGLVGFEPGDLEKLLTSETPNLAQHEPKAVTCPECGHEFYPKA